MSSEHAIETPSARAYSLAYELHYSRRDLRAALGAYDQIIKLHPTTQEAEFSRVQVRNIVRLVIPAAELVDSQLQLALRRLQQNAEEEVSAAARSQTRAE